ncbi:hypothetical protein [Streptomyces sp. CA-111067]
MFEPDPVTVPGWSASAAGATAHPTMTDVAALTTYVASIRFDLRL